MSTSIYGMYGIIKQLQHKHLKDVIQYKLYSQIIEMLDAV